MTHVIVHAGFHKTGTTSLQDFLSQNRSALKPYFDYYGQNDFLNAGAAARYYSQRPFPHRLFQFRRLFRKFLNSIPNHDVIVLSRESFSGGMPGHRTWRGKVISSYQRPALKLARVIIRELTRRFGAEAKITFFYTVRDDEPWIKSVHGHLLRSIDLKDDFEDFRAKFSDMIGPTQQARKLADALAPVPVITAQLEDYAAQPHGLGTAILDLVNVPDALRETLHVAPHSNRGQGQRLRKEYLELNRTELSKSQRKSKKEQLVNTTKR